MCLKKIEELRKNLDSLLADEILDKAKVLALSEELDEIIVEYMRGKMFSSMIADKIRDDN